ncbi:hypothetical protein BD413DRAFT_206317 [Trametes elegans]|nr:hypothetical protein BD413DRAFT_206317 [Trametes elegans]
MRRGSADRTSKGPRRPVITRRCLPIYMDARLGCGVPWRVPKIRVSTCRKPHETKRSLWRRLRSHIEIQANGCLRRKLDPARGDPRPSSVAKHGALWVCRIQLKPSSELVGAGCRIAIWLCRHAAFRRIKGGGGGGPRNRHVRHRQRFFVTFHVTTEY